MSGTQTANKCCAIVLYLSHLNIYIKPSRGGLSIYIMPPGEVIIVLISYNIPKPSRGGCMGMPGLGQHYSH